jgi:uncharacterized protein (DUF58 family)
MTGRAAAPLVPPVALLRTLELRVRKKVDGLLAGDHRSNRLGTGTELAQIRAYVPGDDVRAIDWNATARTGQPHVRVNVAERALTTWLVLDTSASMAWGTQDRRKSDVAEGVALAFTHAATRGVNRIGLVRFGGPGAGHRQPTQGRVGLLAVSTALQELHRQADRPSSSFRSEEAAAGRGTLGPEGRSRAVPGAEAPDPADLAAALSRTARIARTRALVVIVSDLRGDRSLPWRVPLLALAGRHDVIVVEVVDEREQQLPAVGELTLVDPETGRLLRVDTSSQKLRDRFAAAAAADRAAVADAIRATSADHVVLRTSGDWLQPLTTFLDLRGTR